MFQCEVILWKARDGRREGGTDRNRAIMEGWKD